MDQGSLVEKQIEAGLKLALNFHTQYKPLIAAFWLKEDEGQWFLYLASDQIDDTNFDLAYGAVIRLLSLEPHPWLDTFEVKVAGIDDPIVRNIVDIQRKYPGASRRLRNRMIGGQSVEGIYVYGVDEISLSPSP